MDDVTGKHLVTLAVVQMDCTLGDVESNLASVAHYSRAAAEREADLVVFPECATTGYFVPDQLTELAEPPDGRSSRRLSEIARTNRIHLAVGLIVAEHGRVYDAQTLHGPDGRLLGLYRKAHLFSLEKQQFTAGDSPLVVETPIGRIGMRVLWSALADRFAACKLVLHPEKTKIVYCKDANRRGDFPIISFDFLGFQFRARKTMWREGTKRIFAHSFQPAASPKALTFISRTIRRWTLHHSSDKSLPNLAEMYNPCIRGWINYYSNFYRTQLRSTLKRIDLYVIRWARRKFKRLRLKTKGARDWFDRLRRTNPTLFAHWQLCHGNGRASGAV